jgi:hypothetical protein
MRLLPITLLLAIVILLLVSNDGLGQGTDPCANSCTDCSGVCQGPCTPECIDCILDNCQGTDVPISDHAGYLLIGGLFVSSVYFTKLKRVMSSRG